MPHPNNGQPWQPHELDLLRAAYPDGETQTIADALGRSPRAVWQKANNMGLRKSAEFFSTIASGRLQTNDGRSKGKRFTKGFKPWNTGLKGWQAGGRSAQTRFKKGEMHGAAQHNYVPVGTLRIGTDGLLERKYTDNHPVPARRWAGVHRLVWEAAHGPIPPGHVVRFKPGLRTNIEAEITLDRLECITQAENGKRNIPWTKYPPDIARLVQLKGAINRQVNKVNKLNQQTPAAQP